MNNKNPFRFINLLNLHQFTNQDRFYFLDVYFLFNAELLEPFNLLDF